MKFICGLTAGVLLALLDRHCPVALGGTEPVARENGDVNGDQTIDISDAVYLLQWLFASGPPPIPMECDTVPPEGNAKFRMITDIRCGDQAITATLEFCGASVTDETDAPGTFLPSACDREIASGHLCEARVTATHPNCPPLQFCGEVPVETGKVYDFFLVFEGGVPAVGWSERSLDGAGQCPTALKTYSGFLGPCDGAGARAAAPAWLGN